MIVTVMETSFQRLPPNIRHYRDYSNYYNNIFRVSLFNEFSKLNIGAVDLNKFVTACIDTLNNHAPSKKKYIRGNHLPFMNKELSKEIMRRTRLWNNFLRNRSEEIKRKYSKQRNYSVSLLNVEKREILNEIVNLDALKSCQDTDVPTKIIKQNADVFADFIHPAVNASTNGYHLADVIPVFKKGSKNSKQNYRPISILKTIS